MPEVFDNHHLTTNEYINLFKHAGNPAIRECVQRIESIQAELIDWEEQDTVDEHYVVDLERALRKIEDIIHRSSGTIPNDVSTDIQHLINTIL